MLYGSEFQAVGPSTENAQSPSLVLVGGIVYDRLFVFNDTLLHCVGFLSRHRKDRDKKSKRHSSQNGDKGYASCVITLLKA